MTDNRTTELLQKIQSLLDGRGAEYTVQDALPGWLLTVEHPTETWTYKICVHTTGLIDIWGSHITPEQAIAATLGSGTLTAEQVREVAKSNSRQYESPIDDGVWIREYDWQAIAATLNAALGDDGYRQATEYWKGMYEELLTERIGEERDYPEHDGRYECPDCGNVVYYDELYGGGWTIYVEDYQIPFNHCPNCGKAVKR